MPICCVKRQSANEVPLSGGRAHYPCSFILPPLGQSLTAPTILRHLREYKRAVKGGRAFSEYPPQTSLLPELLGSYDLDSGAGRIEMLEMLRHALAVEEGSCAALYGDERSRSIPPWLLLALVPASQDTADSGRLGKEETAEEVRGALEWRVAESLREIEGVRALMQNRTGSNRPGADMGGAAPGMGSSVARDIAVCSATADPATALFEGTLRKWLMCRRREEHKGGESCTDGEYAWDSKAKGGGRPSGMEDSPPVESDLLSLAFRCEAAGEINAQVSYGGRVSCYLFAAFSGASRLVMLRMAEVAHSARFEGLSVLLS